MTDLGRNNKDAGEEMTTSADNQEEGLAEGTLMSHLVELRNRLFVMFGSVFVVFLVLFPFSKPIFEFVSEPLTHCSARRPTHRHRNSVAGHRRH